MKILNIGCGPVESGKTPGIEIINADRKDHPGAEYQDMENLTYPDDIFDLVVCINALDHTKDAHAAIHEMIRVSKKWVYVDCALIQKTTSGKGHHWDMLENGQLTNADTTIDLKSHGFEIEFIDNGMERRYNHVVCRYTK